MSEIFTYRKRIITSQDVEFLTKLIADNPQKSRNALSIMVCREWNWVQPNGALKDGICRGLMLKLHRGGLIKLPARKKPFTGGRQAQRTICKPDIDSTPIHSTVKKLQPIEMRQVRRTTQEKLFNGLVEHHHYLGYTQPVGEHMKYICFSAERPIACFVFASAPYKILLRDRFIGWSSEMLEKNRHLLAYNSRFLILPWIHVPHLASHLLGKSSINIPFTGLKLSLIQSVSRERVSCCELAISRNTSGRGKYNKTQKQLTSIKAMYGLPLVKKYRKMLCQG
jgi:hypothetical protein